jgi:hypothetical protein
MNEFLTIFPIMGPSGTPHWRVSWDERRGLVRSSVQLKRIWDMAFSTGAFHVVFINADNYLTVDSILAASDSELPVERVLEQLNGIAALAFPKEDQAKKFADDLEKVVMWKLLQRSDYA